MSEQGQTEVPENYRAIATLVAGFVDDKLAEFEQRMIDSFPAMTADVISPYTETVADMVNTIESHRAAIVYNGQRLDSQAATVGGLRDAVADLQANAGESMPEHVYKQFIRAEAERLRIVKPTRKPPPRPPEDYSGAPDTDPDTSQ